MRLIDADLPMEQMEKLLDHHLMLGNFSADDAVSDCIEFLKTAPTIDAEPVVRCKDCEYGYLWMNDGTGKIGKCAFLIGDNQYVPAEGFCNLGERKGGE